MDQLKSFAVTAAQREYFQQTQCFNLCVKEFKDSILTESEKTCIRSCLKKYKSAEKVFLDKLTETMEHLAINDPSLRQKFQQSQTK